VRTIAVKVESHGDGIVGEFVEALLKSRKSDRALIARILRAGLGAEERARLNCAPPFFLSLSLQIRASFSGTREKIAGAREESRVAGRARAASRRIR